MIELGNLFLPPDSTRLIQPTKFCRDIIRKAKKKNEPYLVKEVEDNKKKFYKYIGQKRKTKEAMGLLLTSQGNS